MRAPLIFAFLAGTSLLAGPALAQIHSAGADELTEQGTAGPPVGLDPLPPFTAYDSVANVGGELTALWRDRPDLFHAVDDAREAVAAYHRRGAWRPMNVAQLLDGIGEERLLPLLWALASDDPFSLGMGLKAWVGWRVGLIESIGRLRDPRSLPLLLSIVDGPAPQTAIRRAAVAAIGRTGDADAIAAAIALGEASSARRAAVIEGLGQARRAVAVDYLLDISKSAADPALRRAAVRSLGDWGNLEAWRTPVLSPWSAEGEAGRREIVEVLVTAYPEADSTLRQEISKTLQLVDVLESAALAGRLADLADDAAQSAAWRELEAVMKRSPLGARQERLR